MTPDEVARLVGASVAAGPVSDQLGFDPWVEVIADNIRHNVREVPASRIAV